MVPNCGQLFFRGEFVNEVTNWVVIGFRHKVTDDGFNMLPEPLGHNLLGGRIMEGAEIALCTAGPSNLPTSSLLLRN